MALSVATGTPCLGTYPVLESGPALIYLAEDSLSVVRERVLALATYRGLLAPWNDWAHLAARGRHFAESIAHLLLARDEPGALP